MYPNSYNLKIPQRRFILVDFFRVNSHLNTIMRRIIPLELCFNNIQLVLLTTFIMHPLLLNRNLIYTKRDSEDKHDFGVYVPSVNIELAQSMNADHWPKCVLIEIYWFQFEEILEHTYFHAKG